MPSSLSLPLLARQFWSSSATVITILAAAWLLILVANSGEEYTHRLLRNRNLTGSTSVLHLTRWVVDLLIIRAGVFATLHYFGVNLPAALAGLGVGGLAVAFTAQKILENMIGGVSLIIDQAGRVGGILKAGDTSGTEGRRARNGRQEKPRYRPRTRPERSYRPELYFSDFRETWGIDSRRVGSLRPQRISRK